MYPQLVIALYGQYLAAMYAASLFNPASYFPGLYLMSACPQPLPESTKASRLQKPDAARPLAWQDTVLTLVRGQAASGCTRARKPAPVPASYRSGMETRR
jgi:hypothetical protein